MESRRPVSKPKRTWSKGVPIEISKSQLTSKFRAKSQLTNNQS